MLQASLLFIVPGALAARLLFPRLPASHRECLGIIAVFIVVSAICQWQWPTYTLLHVAVNLMSYVPAATGIVYALYWWRRDAATQQELHRTRMGLLALKADHADAELLRLRAQIEPHFLFNTLATIMQLYRSDTPAADRTLALLIDYMNASRANMRHQETVLAQELALAEGFLAIQRLRMGERLHHAIEVPHEVRGNRIPPASLLTLIENAIKHGLAPMAGGGMLRVTAHKDGDGLVVSVSDNGGGFRATSGHGLGLANLRARLHGLYGDGASLRLTSADAGGVVATLRLPLGPPAIESAS
jgi:sensor histidine kinase YesM